MNDSVVDCNQQSGATMSKRVQFAANLTIEKGIHHSPDAESQLPSPSSSSSWYTSKELSAFRRDIASYLDAEKTGTQNKNKTACSANTSETCMRGLEIFASQVRRDLQKHYARSIIKAHRQIRACKRRKCNTTDEVDESVLLQQVAEKCSHYARERAYQIAARDEVDSRSLHEGLSPTKNQAHKHKTPHRICHHSTNSLSSSARLGMPQHER